MASPAVRSVNKSRNTHNYIRTSHGLWYVSCLPHVYITKLWKLILFWSDTIFWRWSPIFDGTGHRKMAVLGMAGDHADNPWKFFNHVILERPKLFGILWNILEWRISDWSVHSGRYILIRRGPLRWVPIAHCAGTCRRGLNILTAVKPVEYGLLYNKRVFLTRKLRFKIHVLPHVVY